MDDIASQLQNLKDEQKAFKKEHKGLFERNTELNKGIRKLGDHLLALMALEEPAITTYEYGGMEFNISSKTSEKHDMDKLNEIMGDSGKYEEYVEQVSVNKSEVRTRNAKRARLPTKQSI
jgi:hypothetical protein